VASHALAEPVQSWPCANVVLPSLDMRLILWATLVVGLGSAACASSDFCGKGTFDCNDGMGTQCPVNGACVSGGCQCGPGHSSVHCDGTPCTGYDCGENYYCSSP
jgi:hypothetical protein